MGKKYRVLSPVILNTSSDPARKQEQSYQPGAEVELDEKQAEQYLQQGWIEDADASQDQSQQGQGQSQGQAQGQKQGQGQPQSPLGRGDAPKKSGG
jgi:hypothetical protein